ncbi:transcription elongation factor, mitochondrial [Engystomops pustulosus]|uniref:transcription elongation factor, mitochondrial n=1 Tax=Engystomops pustulosus TaxID=76066 RepID=UPI003AFB7198
MYRNMKTLIHSGGRILFCPLYCTRGVSSSGASQDGSHGAIPDEEEMCPPHTAPGPQLPQAPYWEEPHPPPNVRRRNPTPSPGLSDPKQGGRRDGTGFIKPEVSTGRLKAADSIVSIVFGMKRLAWAHMDRTMTVRDWRQHEWSPLLKGKSHPDLYLEEVSSALSLLPPTDLYIVEKSSLSSQNASMFPVTLHLRVVEALVYALLNPGYMVERQHRVFSMARSIVGKHFDIMVGGAKTSGVELVQRLVEEAETLQQSRIHLLPELLLQYKHKLHPRGQNRNEELCDALLQAIAFYELLRKHQT